MVEHGNTAEISAMVDMTQVQDHNQPIQENWRTLLEDQLYNIYLSC